MTIDQVIVGAALTVVGYLGLKIFKDLKGMSRKINRHTALLVRWADSEEKRNRVADLIEGK